MNEANCLIIDDVEAALSAMTPIGRQIAAPGARALRDSVMNFANRRDWRVLPYSAYAQWASQLIGRTPASWLVLDPLFPVGNDPDHALRVRVTRAADVGRYLIEDAIGWRNATKPSKELCVLDDAAASGGTLRAMAGRIRATGSIPAHFAVAAMTRAARDVLAQIEPHARVSVMEQGDWRIIHLRDGCPHLPYTGRASDRQLIRTSRGSVIEARLPMSATLNNLWRVLYIDPRINDSILAARVSVINLFAAELGRPPVVEDLASLGTGVPSLIEPHHSPTAFTPLTALLPNA